LKEVDRKQTNIGGATDIAGAVGGTSVLDARLLMAAGVTLVVNAARGVTVERHAKISMKM
jgi:hypothetical protein